MPKDNRIGRQTAHLAASSDEINQRFAALDEAFGEAWLSAGDHPLQALWQRNDFLAINQLFLLGDAVGGLEPSALPVAKASLLCVRRSLPTAAFDGPAR